MALDIEFRYRNDDPWMPTYHAYEIIRPYLQPDSTASAADTAAQINALTPDKGEIPNGGKSEESASFLLEFWEVFISVAQQIPYDHPSQDRLLELAKSLAGLTTPANDHPAPMWSDLNYLDVVVGEQWIEPKPKSASDGQIFEWINLNSFLARLWAMNLFRGDHYAIWTLRRAWEDSELSLRDFQEIRVVAATQYVRHNAPKIRSFMHNAIPDDRDELALSSPAFKGKDVFSPERWDCWREKFREVAELGMSDETKTDASRAARIMDETERRKQGLKSESPPMLYMLIPMVPLACFVGAMFYL